MVHEIRRYFGTCKLAILYLSSITTTVLDVPDVAFFHVARFFIQRYAKRPVATA